MAISSLSISPLRACLLAFSLIQSRLNAVFYLSTPCLLTAITPRSPAHERILREEWEEAKKTGLQFETSQIEKLVPK
jgi:hypothetical protein